MEGFSEEQTYNRRFMRMRSICERGSGLWKGLAEGKSLSLR
jgi:hypothetical protein